MKKIERLKKILKQLKRAVVAYSGGLDSTFLLKVAIDTLGRNNVLAVIARSETYPASEYREAVNTAKRIGAKHLAIHTAELNDRRFRSNPVNRCYYCKKELFKRLNEIRKKQGMNFVLDGTNVDDLDDIRHGRRAAAELGVKSPLAEAGIRKDQIRKYSRELGLPTWAKPSAACLASRIPFGSEITKRGLKKIESAEDYLRKKGFGQVRVRAHGKMARIEVSREDFNKAIKLGEQIFRMLKSIGFTYAALDLGGYRTGSMHEDVYIDSGRKRLWS